MILRLLLPLKPFGLFREDGRFRFREPDNHQFEDGGMHFSCVWCGAVLGSERNTPRRWCPYP